MRSSPHVVVVGGGFGGLSVVKALAREPVQITLLDRANHHLFQPLLYQVAMSGLSPADIASPIRGIVRRQRNVAVQLGEVVDVDPSKRSIALRDRSLQWDYLVFATGGKTSYFGHPEWEPVAPGLKSIDDAIEIRRRVLLAFEAAEKEPDPMKRSALLTFVVVGGGPTGVELAGAIGELARFVLARDFRSIDPQSAHIYLLEAGERILPSFSPRLSQKATAALAKLHVRVRTQTKVTHMDAWHVWTGDEAMASATKIWAAGIAATPLTATIANRFDGVQLDRSGRIIVDASLRVGAHPRVFALGDMVALQQDGAVLPGVSPVAMQMGRFAATEIARDVRSWANVRSAHGGSDRSTDASLADATASTFASSPPAIAAGKTMRRAFRYRDKGSMATIGRNAAVAQLGKRELSGFTAWLTWLVVHLIFLIGFRNRVAALFNWAWSYVTYQRGARLITGLHQWRGSSVQYDGTYAGNATPLVSVAVAASEPNGGAPPSMPAS